MARRVTRRAQTSAGGESMQLNYGLLGAIESAHRLRPELYSCLARDLGEKLAVGGFLTDCGENAGWRFDVLNCGHSVIYSGLGNGEILQPPVLGPCVI